MAIEHIQATADLQAGVKVIATSRDLSFVIDEPKDLGGTNEGPNPVEVVLGALGACQAITARLYSKKFGVEIEDFRVELAGELDLDGLFGKAPVRPGYSDIRYNIHVQSPSPKENVLKLIEFVEKICPVGNTLSHTVGLSLNQRSVKRSAA